MQHVQENTILNIDCLKGMRKLPDNSVDLIISDPPYNVKKDYGNYKDNLPEEDYTRWMREVIFESRRISRRGTCFYVGSKLTKMYWDLIPDAKLIIVHKKAIGIIMKGFFLQYHSLFTTASPIKKCKDLWDDIRLPGEGYYFREPRYKEMPGLTSLKLMERIIEYFSEEEDLIVDPFMGTGTLAIAAKKLDRQFLGFEINQAYIDIAEQRLEELRKEGILSNEKRN